VLRRSHRQRAASTPRHFSQGATHALPRTVHANDLFILY
jgi:hypothetical protein